MIQLHITSTGKSYNPRDSWRMFDEQTKSFPTREAAEEWLKETYGSSKRAKMYVERDGQPDIVAGYVIGFRNADFSHAPVDKWLQQDWIEFREVNTLNIEAA